MSETLEKRSHQLSLCLFLIVRIPNSIRDPFMSLAICEMISVRDTQKPSVESSFQFCCQGPALACIKEGGYDERPHRLYLGVLVPPYRFHSSDI